VTRLADITGLDRLGLPVWQAVRPAGRALIVHHGKGATALAARIGALCEAIESHRAENAAADGPTCRFEDLPSPARAPELADYGRSRRTLADGAGAVRWCAARDLAADRDCFLPFDLVSLDLTAGLSPFEQSSAGLAVGRTQADALVTALCELIERDAVGAWQRAPMAERMARGVRMDTIRFDWFRHWRGLLAAHDIFLSVHAPDSPTGVPVFACAISGPGEFAPARRTFTGEGAHASAEIALFRALAEAIQSRLTFIAGVRDDILPAHYSAEEYALGLPLPVAPPGMAELDFAAIADGPEKADALISALGRLGYDRVAAKSLGPDVDGLAVMKVFVPGLGTHRRRRRTP
jgi:ribosomal protein S12 methylthiotransferase accessory factor